MAEILQPTSYQGDIEGIDTVTINSAAGNLTNMGTLLNNTDYYDETVSSHPKNKTLLILGTTKAAVSRYMYGAYVLNDTTIRGLYCGDTPANGDQIPVIRIRFKESSLITVQHDLYNNADEATMDLTITSVPADSIFVPCMVGSYAADWDIGTSNVHILTNERTSQTNVRMTVSVAGTDNAIWPSQIIIPNGAF